MNYLDKKDKIIKRIYLKAELKNTSPLIIGSGEDENSDIDFIRGYDGKLFIPATSLSGVLRNHLKEKLKRDGERENKLVKILFGEREKESTQSLLTFYDAYLKNSKEVIVSIRDGIEIDRITGTTKEKAKYDYEIIEPGAKFDLKLELIIRENTEKSEEMAKLFDFMIDELKNGEIRLGAKTRRGFGKIKLDNIKILRLNMKDKEDIEKWIDFDWDNSSFEDFESETYTELPFQNENKISISAKFEIPYSIIIKHYNEDPKDVDSTHLKSGGKPVISGTSWNGALKSAIYNILKEISKDNPVDMLNEIFGYSKDSENLSYKERHRASKIYIEESVIEGSKSLKYTRNKIDRFTGGTREGALFDSKPEYGGEVELNLVLKESEPWNIGLIILGIRELGNGFQAIGGEKNIGRGILKLKGININNGETDEEFYLKKLAEYLAKKSKQGG